MGSVTDGPATSYVRAATKWSRTDWWQLEAKALGELPDLRRQLAFFSPIEARPFLAANLHTKVGAARGCLLTLTNIASFTLPTVAAFLLFSWSLGGSEQAAPLVLAGVLAGIAAIIAGIGLITEVRRQLGTDPKIGRMLALWHIVPALVGLMILVAAGWDGSEGGLIGTAGLLADLVVGGLHFTVYRGVAQTNSQRWARQLDRLKAALDATPLDVRARIYSDVQAALALLAEREFISRAEWEQAREAPIGLLGLEMAPREA
ncbi:hypothetical protein [Microbacterium sp. C7(2022)]|uniref:hypothetical protein n=1 Tax=Microbacterium sp. C7(2022) TaxID=2992759 RepID=UPI00237B256C|nr:hypothetical protein [Microbacterium sp. C7(2022)]MDE0547482.1 hypothetical protein [Microbacterium sp. C7(2022)]